MGNIPAKRSQFLPYLCLALLALIATLLPENIVKLLEFERSALVAGEWWRTVSAQFLHTNFNHAVVNLFGLGILWLMHGDYIKPTSFTILFVMLSVALTLGVFYLTPELKTYVGLSGVLHGMFAWGVIHDIKLKRVTGYLLLLGLLVKLAQEQFMPDTAFMEAVIGATVAVDAHLYGAVAGLILGFLIPINTSFIKQEHTH